MAKKPGKNDGNVGEMDFDDIEGMDFDSINIDEMKDDRKPGISGVSKEFAKSARDDFLSSTIKQTAKKALPDEYSEHYDEAKDYADFAKETFVTSKNKINKSVYRFAKEAKKILPFQSNLLDKYLGKFESDFETAKAQSEEDMHDTSIQSNLTSIFDKQIEFQKAIEAKKSAEKEVEDKQTLVNDKITNELLTSIDNNLNNQTSFTFQIAKEYYKKSLELQFKSYFIQADMLKTMREYYKGFSSQFDYIAKNTSLPDFIKLKNTESLQQEVKKQLTQDLYKNVFSNSDYIKGIKAKMGKVVSEKVTDVTEKIDQTTDMMAMFNDTAGAGGGKANMLSNIIGGMFGSTLGEKLANKIAPGFKDKLKDNKHINAGGNFLSTLANSPSTFFKMFKTKVEKTHDNLEGKDTPIGMVGSKITGFLKDVLQVTDPEKIKTSLNQPSILTHNQAAIFDNKVHRSITEVIPLYLSKILKENTDLRNMYYSVNMTKINKSGYDEKGSEELSYDYTGRKLDTKSNIKANVEKEIAAKTGNQKLKNLSNTIISTASKADNLKNVKIDNQSNKRMLEDYFIKASKIEGLTFDKKTVLEGYSDNAELKAIVESNDKLKTLITNINKANITTSEKDYLDRSVKDANKNYPIESVKGIFKQLSIINGIKLLNFLTDEEALYISKALTNYIINIGKDIYIDNITNGTAFSFLLDGVDDKIKDKIKVFIRQVRDINDSDDILRQSKLINLLALLNKSLKSNININPEVFKTLSEYSPDIIRGELSASQLVEGKLDTKGKDSYINSNDLVDIRRANKKETKDILSNNTTDFLTEKLSGIVNKVSDTATNARTFMTEGINTAKEKYNDIRDKVTKANGDPRKIAEIIAEESNKLYDQVENITKESYAKASETFDSITKEIGTLGSIADETKVIIIGTIIGKLDKVISEIDTIINKEKIILDNSDSQLANMEDAVADNIMTESKKLNKTINKNKIAALIASKQNLIKLKSKFIEHKNDKIQDLLLGVGKEIQDTITNIRANIDKFNIQLKEELAKT